MSERPRRSTPLGRDDLPSPAEPARDEPSALGPAPRWPVPPLVRLAAALVASLLAFTATGDAFVPAALLAAAAGPLPGAVAVLAVAASWVRWGSSDLDAIGGAQSVLGPAVVVGPAAGAASAVLAAAAVVVVARRLGDGRSDADAAAAVGLGVLAGTLAAGPQLAGAAEAAIRAIAAVAGSGVALAAAALTGGSPVLRRRHAWASATAVLVAVGLAALV